PELIKFAASLAALGGVDSRSNSIAAKLAGMSVGRTQAYRYARSVSVRKLLNKAGELKSGQRKLMTEDEIDARIEDMIRSPNDLASAKGIELRDKRKPPQVLSHDESDSFAALVATFGENAARLIDELTRADSLVKDGLKVPECTCGLRLNVPKQT